MHHTRSAVCRSRGRTAAPLLAAPLLAALFIITLPAAVPTAEAQVESTGPRLTKQQREGITFRGCFASGFTKGEAQGEADDTFYDAISKNPKYPDGNILTALLKTGSWQMWNMEVLPKNAEGKPKKQQQGASRPEVRKCIQDAKEQLSSGDQFLFLFNGHGMDGGGLAIGPHDDPDNKGGTITRGDLSGFLTGFRKGVSITVVLLSCFGFGAWDSGFPNIPALKDVKFRDENGSVTVDGGPYVALITSATPGVKRGFAFSGDIYKLIDAVKATHDCPHPGQGCRGRFPADTDKDDIITAKEAAVAAGFYGQTGKRRCLRCVGGCEPDAPGAPGETQGDLKFSYFGPPPHALETRGAGPGSGTIFAEPPAGIHWETPRGIDCMYQNGVPSEDGCRAIFTGSPVRLRAAATDGSVFGGWSGDVGSDCGDADTCDVVMDADRVVTATFTRKVSLQIAGAGAGSGTVTAAAGGIACTSTAGVVSGTCGASYNLDAMVTLTASPAANSTFAGWGGACAGAALTCALPMNSDRNATATFAVREPVGTHRLVVTVAGRAGRVISNPAGIDCANGADPEMICEAFFPADTLVMLTATVVEQGPVQFGGWFGGPCVGSFDPVCSVRIVDDEQRASAVFDGWPRVVIHFATAGPNGLGSGTVTSEPAGINCGTDGSGIFGTCEAPFPAGQIVTLTATPTNGSFFSTWVALQTPECDGSANPVCRFTVPRGDWPNLLAAFSR